jgi:hypothetical protein
MCEEQLADIFEVLAMARLRALRPEGVIRAS